MATVVVTFLITFYVFKMDADCKKRPRDRVAQRQKRWSMNSQRLEEIVAELMRPISDVRHSFDTDLCTLLEEYLTEAGLHALEASEQPGSPGPGATPGGGAVPNFAELALLLQQSASIYGRKVDFLYQHVLDVSDSLHNSSSALEAGSPRAEEAPSTPGSRRKRKASAGAGPGVAGSFEPVELCACAAARREAGGARPPPTLPRLYAELAPRALDPRDLQLRDYGGEPVGLLADLHVAWRLQDGLLVDELEDPSGEAGQGAGGGSLRPIPLLELQAAIEAAAPPPPAPPPPPATPSPPASPPPAPPSPPATPPPDPPPLETSTPEVVEKCTIAKKDRKRKSQDKIDNLVEGSINMVFSKKMALRLGGAARCEFAVPGAWLRNTVHSRAAAVRALRRLLAAHAPRWTEFRGFEPTNATDVGGFSGWSATEVEAAGAALRAGAGAGAGAGAEAGDSDDDGFFELSEPGESDASRADDSPVAADTGESAAAAATTTTTTTTSPVATDGKAAAAAELAAWRARVAAGAAAAERRQLDVRQVAARVLAALPPAPGRALPFERVLGAAAADHADVSRLFLATLFLANAGSVEVVGGAPLALGGFSLRRASPGPPGPPGALPPALPGALDALPALPAPPAPR